VEEHGISRQATDENTIRRMSTKFCTTKATITHSEYVIFTVFPLQQRLQKARLNITLYVHCLSGLFAPKYFGETPRSPGSL